MAVLEEERERERFQREKESRVSGEGKGVRLERDWKRERHSAEERMSQLLLQRRMETDINRGRGRRAKREKERGVSFTT